MVEDGLRSLAHDVSNWGRWGPEDERGTLNLITPAITQRALALIRGGDVLSLGKALRVKDSKQHPPSALQFPLATGSADISAQDALFLNPHGFEMTHLDALGHSFFDGCAYNGRKVADILTADGLSFASISNAASGIVTRGVLLDVAEAAGVPFLGRHAGISAQDLEKCEEFQGVRIGEGDAIFVRSGLDARELAEGTSEEREGVLPEILRLLHERDVAIYSGDCIEKLPSGYADLPVPFHQIGMAMMGLTFLDNPDVERLAAACRSRGRYEFTLVIAPLDQPGGTASPVNPLVLF
jgi:hypothetical protein